MRAWINLPERKIMGIIYMKALNLLGQSKWGSQSLSKSNSNEGGPSDFSPDPDGTIFSVLTNSKPKCDYPVLVWFWVLFNPPHPEEGLLPEMEGLPLGV
jgi:hypothetical protein